MHPGRNLPCSTGRAATWQQQQQQHVRQQQQLWLGVPGGHCKQHRVATAAATGTSNDKQQKPSKQQQPASSRDRNARLYELFDDDGWGVEAVAPAAQQPAASPAAAPAQPKRAQNPQQQTSEQGKRRKAGTRFADMRSQEGKLGLTLLQKVLLNEEEQQQQQQQQQQQGSGAAADSSSSRDQPSIADVRAKLAAAADSSKRLKPKLPGFPKASAAGGAAAAAAAGSGAGGQLFGQASSGSELMYADEEEDDDEDEATPAFQITFDEQGRAAMESFTSEEATAAAGDGEDADSDVDLDDFGMSGWGQFAPDEPVQQQPPTKGRGRKAANTAKDDDDEAEMALLRDLSNEDDWGLEALTTPARSTFDRQQRSGRQSLIDELTAAEEEELDGSGNAFNGSVRWGGTAGTTGIDMEEQEAVLTRYFRPDQVKKLMKEQQEVDESYSVLRKRAVGLGVSDHKLQEKLRIVSGSAAGRKLVSFRSPQTRPMMEKVRQAIFNMLQSRASTLNCLPRTARWLDLFAGTGSVGLEALSRGVREAHFVEMDPVVVSKVLERNIKSCGFKGKAWTHTSKAEDFLRRSAATPRFAGGAFDFISVCPPYLLVSYPELFELLDASPLVHPGTILFVEYPKQLSHQIVDSIGPLQRVRDRRYGRTWVALYAAGAADDDGDADELADPEDPFLAMQ